jgi:hypothetical protein
LDSLKQVNIDDNTKWHSIVSEPTNKLAFLTFRRDYYKELRLTIGRTQPSTTLLENNVRTVSYFMILSDKLPFTRMFKLKIDNMISSGLIQKWHDEYFMVERDAKKYVEEADPQILNVETLRYGFYAYLIALTFSTAAFVAEVLVVHGILL